MGMSREPKLRVRASGLGGSGYRIPTRPDENGKLPVVPGVTTVMGALDKPAVVQWAVDNTAAFAVAMIDQLYDMSEEQGFGVLRWYHKRAKPSDFDDPALDVRNYSAGVLDDAAELGTLMHEWIEDHVNGRFEPELVRVEQAEMVEAFLGWYAQHEVDVVVSEVTVLGHDSAGRGWAGTLDHVWIIDGVPTLVDVKTSRNIYTAHLGQLAALGSAESMLWEVDKDAEGAYPYEVKGRETTYWVERPVPEFVEYAILQVRPDDFTAKGEFKPAYCELHHIPQVQIDAAYGVFVGALQVRHGELALKNAQKEAA